MLPPDAEIVEEIIHILADSVPGTDADDLGARLSDPLELICPIKSLIGVDIATQLAEKYALPELPRTKLRDRKDYISVEGLLEHIKKRSMHR
jgi:hypothetical protein